MAVLHLLVIIALPLAFCFAIAYFFALKDYRDTLVLNHRDVWNAEIAKSRPMESWAQPAYRLLRGTRSGKIGNVELSAGATAARTKAARMLYLAAGSLMIFIVVALLLEALPE